MSVREFTPRPEEDQAEIWDEKWEARWAGRGRIVRWTVTVAALALCSVAATLVVAQVDASVESRRGGRAVPVNGNTAAATDRVGEQPVELVRTWDRRRARAWRGGDTEALAGLYVRGASAGRADVANLRRWTALGWTVASVPPQLLAVEEVDRRAERWVVDVTDRLTGVRATRGQESVLLPATGVSTRRIVFVQRRGTWRVEQVTAT